MSPMMDSTNRQNLNVKFLILFRIHKNDKCVDWRIVNSSDFKIIKPIRFCYFCGVYKYKEFHIAIVHFCRFHHYLHLEKKFKFC
jgi:hypothetical protein